MKYTDKIRRLAWSLEFGATYMELTGRPAMEAFGLADRAAVHSWDIIPAASAARAAAERNNWVASTVQAHIDPIVATWVGIDLAVDHTESERSFINERLTQKYLAESETNEHDR